MRMFLSTIKNISLAIPIDQIASIVIYKGIKENDYEYISLPEIFKENDIETHHGIKINNSPYILLTTKIDSDIDITQDDVYALPKTLNRLESSSAFKGLKFAKDKFILILNPIELIKYIVSDIKTSDTNTIGDIETSPISIVSDIKTSDTNTIGGIETSPISINKEII